MRYTYFLCLVIGLLLLGACQANREKINCTVAIYTDNETLLAETSVAGYKGDSVLDILKSVTRSENIQMEFTGAGATAYVKGIGNLYEFDKGPESGWIYRVNNEVGDKSAGVVKPEDGDAIVWQYVLAALTP